MDNESYNVCLDLVEWFESVCQTIPQFELSRNCFNIDGKVVRVSSPGILRVTLREQASCLTLLYDLRRWLQISIEYHASFSENIDLNQSLHLVSEMLEREIEKDKYRSFFHGATNCSLKANWYSGTLLHLPSTGSLVPKQSLKRKPSIKTVTGGEPPAPSKKLVTTVSESASRKPVVRRGIIPSDSDDEGDGDFRVAGVETESKRKLESKPSIRIKTPTDNSVSVRVNPTPPKPRTVVNLDPALKEAVLSILQPLLDNKAFDLFVEPVPRTVTDYYEFIDSPLCLKDMLRKLNTGKYKKLHSIQKDIQLIIVNCIYYNMLNDSLQASNRKMAYLLFESYFERFYEYEPKLKEQGTVSEYKALFRCYTELIESVYAITENNYQLIRYFAVDPKKLHEYDRFVKKPITLRTILTKLIALEYLSFDRIKNDFNLLFENCIHYWRSYNYSAGKVYVDAAQILKDRFDGILTQAIDKMSDEAQSLLTKMTELREKRKQELLEKKKGEIRPSLMSLQNADEFIQEAPTFTVAQPTVFTRTSNRIHNFEDPLFTPPWAHYAHRCLDLLKERVFPYWCWSLFTTPIEQLLKQPDYENEILTPITWMTIEGKLNSVDKATFCGSMRLLFDNCLAYNQPRSINTTPAINWIRDPCKFLYNEFNLLWKSFAINPTPQDYQTLMDSLKSIRLDGYVPYFDFEENPKNYYSDYFTITEQPMGFNDTLHSHGSFDEWCDLIRKIFNDAKKYHSNNRGSPFIAAEADYLLSEFERICVIAKDVVSRGGSVSEIQCPAEKLSLEGCRVYTVDSSRMPADQCKRCRQIVNEFRKVGEHFPLFRNYIRTPTKNTMQYLKHVERLVYIDDISRALDANEYHSLTEFKNDFNDMLSNLIYYYQGTEKKEVVMLFTDFMKSVFGDIYRYSRVDPSTGIEDFFNSNRSILSKLYQEEKIEDFFKSFKQDCRNSYYLLNSSALRTIVTESSVESEVVISADANAAILDRVLPTVSEIEENPLRNCGRNYWDFLNNLLNVLAIRLQAAEELGDEPIRTFTKKAIQRTKEIFASKIKSSVLNHKISTYNNRLISTTSQLEKQRIVHRPNGNQVSYLNANEMRVYDSPSLYVLKVAKKAVLRELRPEIVEKEKEKKDETPAPAVKLKLFGKDVEKEASTPVATIMTNEDEPKEELESKEKEKELYSIPDSFEI